MSFNALFVPTLPFENFKWQWACLQCTEGLNDPVVLLGVLFRLRKLELLNHSIKYSSNEFKHELEELADDIRETDVGVDLARRTGKRNLIRNSGQYWSALGLIPSERAGGVIRLTEFGQWVADRKISQTEFAALTIQTLTLPNRLIQRPVECAKWDEAGIELKPLLLLLDIVRRLSKFQGQGYLTKDEYEIKNELKPESMSELVNLTEAELERVDIGRMNLICAKEAFQAIDFDLQKWLRTLDVWAEHVRRAEQRFKPSFERNPARYDNSYAKFKAVNLVLTLKEDFHCHYEMSLVRSGELGNWNYDRDKDASFRRAAETAKITVENSYLFDSKCDEVLLRAVGNAGKFEDVWQSVSNETSGDDPKLKVQEVHLFAHSGPGEIFMQYGSIGTPQIKSLPRLNWTKNGKIISHGCNSGVCNTDGDSVAGSMAKRQRVVSEGQTGFSQFSERPDRRTYFSRVGSDSKTVYLWSFGDGGPSYTFGTARPTRVFKYFNNLGLFVW